MTVTIDRTAWERGVRDGLAGARASGTNEAYSYWSGWIEGDAARRGYEVSIQVAAIWGLLPHAERDEPALRAHQ